MMSTTTRSRARPALQPSSRRLESENAEHQHRASSNGATRHTIEETPRGKPSAALHHCNSLATVAELGLGGRNTVRSRPSVSSGSTVRRSHTAADSGARAESQRDERERLRRSWSSDRGGTKTHWAGLRDEAQRTPSLCSERRRRGSLIDDTSRAALKLEDTSMYAYYLSHLHQGGPEVPPPDQTSRATRLSAVRRREEKPLKNVDTSETKSVSEVSSISACSKNESSLFYDGSFTHSISIPSVLPGATSSSSNSNSYTAEPSGGCSHAPPSPIAPAGCRRIHSTPIIYTGFLPHTRVRSPLDGTGTALTGAGLREFLERSPTAILTSEERRERQRWTGRESELREYLQRCFQVSSSEMTSRALLVAQERRWRADVLHPVAEDCRQRAVRDAGYRRRSEPAPKSGLGLRTGPARHAHDAAVSHRLMEDISVSDTTCTEECDRDGWEQERGMDSHSSSLEEWRFCPPGGSPPAPMLYPEGRPQSPNPSRPSRNASFPRVQSLDELFRSKERLFSELDAALLATRCSASPSLPLRELSPSVHSPSASAPRRQVLSSIVTRGESALTGERHSLRAGAACGRGDETSPRRGAPHPIPVQAEAPHTTAPSRAPQDGARCHRSPSPLPEESSCGSSPLVSPTYAAQRQKEAGGHSRHVAVFWSARQMEQQGERGKNACSQHKEGKAECCSGGGLKDQLRHLYACTDWTAESRPRVQRLRVASNVTTRSGSTFEATREEAAGATPTRL